MGPAVAAESFSHTVQFYRDDGYLTDVVTRFIADGLAAGDAVVIIATPAHRDAFCERLQDGCIDVARACAAGQLVLVDAAELLERILDGDMPDAARFGDQVDAILAPLEPRPVRAFGEMVDLLWRAGNFDGALRLEELWNDLERPPLRTLLCAYHGEEELPEIRALHRPARAGSRWLIRERRAGERLRESEIRLQLLLDSIKDYAIFMLDARGYISSWNPGAQRIKGWTESEIVGRHFSTFYPQEDVRAGKCEMELRMASETGRFEDEGWRVRKDGSRFWANVVISAVRDAGGALVGFAKVTRDLTERRRAEEERAGRTAAEQANRAKDEFLAMLGHELRNPLAPIVTALQLLKLRGDRRSGHAEEVIERQVQHMVRLVDDLLDVSRITQGKVELKRESFELAEIVAKAVETVSPLLELRRHRLQVAVPRVGMRLVGDSVRLCQVLTNLLTNAAKYTEVEGELALAAWRDGHEIVIQVKDSGAGISAELLPRVFDLFVQGQRTTDRAQGGLGLGLTLVRSLVQLHGGTVVALSDGPGMGSAFVVRLPSAADGPGDTQPGLGRPREKTTRPRRILLVDDNADAASLMAELFLTLGHEVVVAHDGPQALAALANFTPEVAVLDIGLPVMDGYELARRIHDVVPACKLIALTGYGQEHDRRRSEKAGFAEHLVKPVDPERVLQAVSR